MSGHADTIRGYIKNSVPEWKTPIPYLAAEAWDAVSALAAENQQLRDGIENYLLWEPGRAGYAEAHRRLAALVALDGKPSAANDY